MQDFGECLVDVRDRLSVPLPLRVQKARLFVLTVIEVFCTPCIRLFSRTYQFVPDRLPHEVDQDMKEVQDAFAELQSLQPTADQVTQAHDLFIQEINRRMHRMSAELDTCIRIMRAAMFLGLACVGNAVIAAIISEIEGNVLRGLQIIIGMMVVQLVGTFICINGFIRCRLR